MVSPYLRRRNLGAPLASCQNRDLPTARWEHRIGARRELDHNNFLRDFYRISCECSLELFGDLAELPVSQHRRGSGQAQREYCYGNCDWEPTDHILISF